MTFVCVISANAEKLDRRSPVGKILRVSCRNYWAGKLVEYMSRINPMASMYVVPGSARWSPLGFRLHGKQAFAPM